MTVFHWILVALGFDIVLVKGLGAVMNTDLLALGSMLGACAALYASGRLLLPERVTVRIQPVRGFRIWRAAREIQRELDDMDAEMRHGLDRAQRHSWPMRDDEARRLKLVVGSSSRRVG